jgi:CHAP domain-containing protein
MRARRSLFAGLIIGSVAAGPALAAVPAVASTTVRPAVVQFRLSASARRDLRGLYASDRQIPLSDIGRAVPGAVHAARITATGRDWAVMKFVAGRLAPLAVSVGFQDGGGSAVFTRPAGRPWHLVGLGGPLLSCDGRLPRKVRTLWGYSDCPTTISRRPTPRVPNTGTMNGVATIANNEVGVQDDPTETTFNGAADCNPFTGFEYTPASDAGCGVDTTDFSTSIQDRTEFWCSDFAKWVWSQAGVTSNLSTLNPGANSFLTWADQSGQTLTLDGTSPQVGDAIVLFAPGTFGGSGGLTGYSPTNPPPGADHVGIVVGVNGSGAIQVVNGDFIWNGSNIAVTTTGSYWTPAAFANAAEDVTSPSQEQWVFVSPQLSSGGTAPVPNSPAAGVDSSFNVYTFWKGTDATLWENNRNGSGVWNGAHKIAGMGTLGSQPTVAVTSGGNQYVFWKGTNAGYLYEAYNLNGTWYGPNKVTDTQGDPVGPMGSAPAAGVDSSGNVYVFYENSSDSGLEETSGLGYQPGSFSGFHEISGTAPLGSVPTVAVTGGGNQYVFWQNASGYLYEAYNLNGTWNGPSLITDSGTKMGPMASAPTAGVDGSGNIYVFWENSSDNGLEETSGLGYQPASFNAQHEISGMAPLGSAPTVAVTSGGNQLVFWKGSNSHADLFEANWNGSWNGPTNLGGGPLG